MSKNDTKTSFANESQDNNNNPINSKNSWPFKSNSETIAPPHYNEHNIKSNKSNNDNNNQQFNNKSHCPQSFCEVNKKSIIITSIVVGILIIFFLIILFAVILKKNKDVSKSVKSSDDNISEDKPVANTNKESSPQSTDKESSPQSTDKEDSPQITYTGYSNNNEEICLLYENTGSNNCLKCKEEFILNEGKCLPYAFYVDYQINSLNENIQLLNPNKISNIYKMDINNAIMNPFSEFNLRENRVYFYLNENTPISLSNMFENITKLKYFIFNNNYINNFIINDMKSMFLGCISLQRISFDSFIGENINDISYLFSNCTSLNSVSFSNFKPTNLLNMDCLFCNCSSLTNIDFSNLDTSKVTNMSEIFYNCSALKSLDIRRFNT